LSDEKDIELNSFSHILGYVGKLNKEELDKFYNQGYLPADFIGKSGVEKNYESYLRGKYGRRRIEVNANGKKQTILSEESPVAGTHIKLSINQRIQNNLEKIMKDVLSVSGKKRASGIVMNPKNGEIMALVSLPGFNNNDFSGGIDSKKYNFFCIWDRTSANGQIKRFSC
jgi:penicillin-binding protein 2